MNAVITNTLPYPINLENTAAGAYAVVYNASGRIIGQGMPSRSTTQFLIRAGS